MFGEITTNRCPNLGEVVPFHSDTSTPTPENTAIFIEPQPSPDRPFPIDVVLESAKHIKELGFYQEPVFLDKYHGAVCSYPLRFVSHGKNAPVSQVRERRDPQGWFQEKFLKNFGLFGTPTRYFSKSPVLSSGVLFDPQHGLFYGNNGLTGNWFLIGGEENFYAFTQAIQGITTFLEKGWKENHLDLNIGRRLILDSPETPEEIEKKNPQPPWLAEELIQHFMNWLKLADPTLWNDTKEKVSYAPVYKFRSNFQKKACTSQDYANSDAFADSEQNKIFFMPQAIRNILDGKYAETAAILAHERAHLENYNAGLIPPSFLITTHAVIRFMGTLSQSPAGRAILDYFGEQFLFEKLTCDILPTIHEEEASAYANDFIYSQTHPHLGDASDSQINALSNYEYHWKNLISLFPPEVLGFSAEYFILAQNKDSSESSWWEAFNQDLSKKLISLN